MSVLVASVVEGSSLSIKESALSNAPLSSLVCSLYAAVIAILALALCSSMTYGSGALMVLNILMSEYFASLLMWSSSQSGHWKQLHCRQNISHTYSGCVLQFIRNWLPIIVI